MAKQKKVSKTARVRAQKLATKAVRELGDDPEALELVLRTVRILAARSRVRRR